MILFAAVQITMFGIGILRGGGETFAGLFYLVSPGLTVPSLAGGAILGSVERAHVDQRSSRLAKSHAS